MAIRHRITETGLDGTVFSLAEFADVESAMDYWNDRARSLPKDRTLTESVPVGADWVVIVRWPFN